MADGLRTLPHFIFFPSPIELLSDFSWAKLIEIKRFLTKCVSRFTPNKMLSVCNVNKHVPRPVRILYIFFMRPVFESNHHPVTSVDLKFSKSSCLCVR